VYHDCLWCDRAEHLADAASYAEWLIHHWIAEQHGLSVHEFGLLLDLYGLFGYRTDLLTDETVCVLCKDHAEVLFNHRESHNSFLLFLQGLQRNGVVGADELAHLAVVVTAVLLKLHARCEQAVESKTWSGDIDNAVGAASYALKAAQAALYKFGLITYCGHTGRSDEAGLHVFEWQASFTTCKRKSAVEY